MGKKTALLFGCNYPHTSIELHCCDKDCHIVKEYLITYCGFQRDDIRIVVDSNPSISPKPTSSFITKELYKLVRNASKGDTIFCYFSGHGDRTKSPSGINNTNYIEGLVAADGLLVTDVVLRQITEEVPLGCNFTMLCDSCHSGGMIEGAPEQIGSSTVPVDMYILEQKVDVPTKRKLGILLSACQTHEVTSSNRHISYFTEVILDIIRETNGLVTYRQLITEAKVRLNGKGFSQTPGLYCSDKQASMLFLGDEPLDLI